MRKKIKKEKTNYIIHSVLDAIDILEQLQDGVDELGLADLSRRLKFHKNKVFRLLATLESRDYVEQNLATGCYRLGLKSLHLAQTFVDQMGLLRQATVVQEALVRECNETSCVAILKGTQTVCLNAIESDLPVRVALSAGQRRPIHCTAAGKVLVSSLAKENVLEYIHSVELRRYTKNTICDRDELVRHLNSIKELKYAVNDEEMEVGVKCISAPILDYTRHVVGALTISGPSVRMAEKRINNELIPLVKKAAEEISARLGY